MTDYVGSIVVECKIDPASLLTDEAGVRSAAHLPIEVHDIENIYVLETALDSRDDILFQLSVGRHIVVVKRSPRMNDGLSDHRITKRKK